MRENGVEVGQGLVNGIAPHPLLPPDAPYADVLQNLVPEPFAAVNPDRVTAGVEFTPEWPHPRLFNGEDIVLRLDAESISSVNLEDGTAQALTLYDSADNDTEVNIAASDWWQAVSYEDLYFACDGQTLIAGINRNLDGEKNDQVVTPITVGCIGQHFDRLLLGALDGEWFEGARFQGLFDIWRKKQGGLTHDLMTWSRRFIIYGERRGGDTDTPFRSLLTAIGAYGNAAFDRIEGELKGLVENGKIGFASMRQAGEPRILLSQGQRFVAFGTRGIFVFSPVPNSEGYSGQLERTISIAGRGAACAGTDTDMVWVSASGDLYRWRLNDGIKNLQFRHKLAALSNPIVSYDADREQYRIADDSLCYVLTRENKLGGPLTVRTTDLFRHEGALFGLGIGLDEETLEVKYVRHPMDMGYRGSKHSSTLEVIYEGLEDITLEMPARVSAIADYKDMPGTSVPLAEEGFGFPAMSGNDFKPTVKGTADAGSDYALQGVLLRYNSEGREGRRGTTAAAIPDFQG